MKIVVLALLAIYVTSDFVNPSNSYNIPAFTGFKEVGIQKVYDAVTQYDVPLMYFYSNIKGEPVAIVGNKGNLFQFINPLNGDVLNEYILGDRAALYFKHYFYEGHNFVFVVNKRVRVLYVFRDEALIGAFSTMKLGENFSIAIYDWIIFLTDGEGHEQTLYFRGDLVDGSDYFIGESNFTNIETVFNNGKQYIVDKKKHYDPDREPWFYQNITIWNRNENKDFVKVHTFEMLPESVFVYLDDALFLAYKSTVYRYNQDGTVKSIDLERIGNFINIGRLNDKTFVVGTDMQEFYIIDSDLKAFNEVDYDIDSTIAHQVALFDKYLLVGRYSAPIPRTFRYKVYGDIVIYELETKKNLFSFLE